MNHHIGLLTHKGDTMTKQQYLDKYQKSPKWELLNIKRALETFGGFLNTEEENIRLEAVKQALKIKRGKK